MIDNEEYIYIKNLADTLGIYESALEQIFLEIEFINIIDGRNNLINEGLEYGKEYLGYTNFKPSVLKHPLIKEAVNRHFKALETNPKREKEAKSRYVEQLREHGYIVKNNDSMNIIAVKDYKTLNLEFQDSDHNIVSTSFEWKETKE